MEKKFSAVSYCLSSNHLPVFDGCVGYLDCLLEDAIDTGDHTLFIGNIVVGGMINPVQNDILTTADYMGVYRGT